jgi:hypothetical protein
VLLETFDTNVIDNLQEGMEVRCGFSHRIREYEGRTYNEVRLYKIQSIKKSQEPAAPQAPASYDNTPPPPQQVEKKNDLPF